MAAFVSYDVSLQFIRELRSVHSRLASYDAEEADQLHRAAGSIVRNVAEGAGRTGKIGSASGASRTPARASAAPRSTSLPPGASTSTHRSPRSIAFAASSGA